MPDEPVPPPEPTPPEEPSVLGSLAPNEMITRGMQPVKMTGGAAGHWQPPTVEECARLFSGYEVLKLLGRGGMGAVYQARQLALDRDVAIKLLPLEVSIDHDFAERFRREARAMAKLNHPNIIAVYDFGTTSEGHLFFVMEFVKGANLADVIHHHKVGLDTDQALSVAEQVCKALSYAHTKGIVHRDIKPANVMIDTDSHVKVADFGLARLADSTDLGSTVTGTVMGTPDYMAPEQMKAMDVDHRADIYSLGVMIYEMICREVPRGVFHPPSYRTGCDSRIDRIVLKAMQQAPEDRYQSTQEMKGDLTSARSAAEVAEPIGGLLPPAVRTAMKPIQPSLIPKKSKWPLFGGIAAAVLAAIAAAVFLVPQFRALVLGPAPAHMRFDSSASREGRLSGPAGLGLGSGKSSASTPGTIASASGPASEVKPVPIPAATPSANHVAVPAPAHLEPLEIKLWDAADKINFPGGRWEDGALRLDRGAPTFMENLSRDAVVRVRVKMNPDAEYPQIHLRRRDAEGGVSSYYRVIVLAGEKMIRLEAVPFDDRRSAKSIMLGNWPLPRSYGANDWALIELQAEGRRLTVSIDGRKLGGAEDETVSQAGGVGVVAAKNGFFKDIVYLPLDQGVASAAAIASAARASPFENTLGMKFVPVPIVGGPTAGQRLLVSIWDTRVQDYEIFVDETKRDWPKVDYAQGPAHPAVKMSWDDAQAFCQWLTLREQAADRLPRDWQYRLPSDHEWSCAVDLGALENPATLPVDKTGMFGDVFPWGKEWPPPPGAGNYAGEEMRPLTEAGKYKGRDVLNGYLDGFVETSPVGSFESNRFGLYDMGGNVWQWCGDWIDASKRDRVLRGASWRMSDRGRLVASNRNRHQPGSAYDDYGFRCVIAHAPAADAAASGVAASPAPPPSAPPSKTPPSSATKDTPFMNSLAMKFVPVPGTKVLFAIWDTRVRDYAAYARTSKADDSWKKQERDGVPVGRGPEDPVVGVNWNDAHAFCDWLTAREMAEDRITKGQRYRLPTDEEWSVAVGLPAEQGSTPAEKSGRNQNLYPWGAGYPPPKPNVGNYLDSTAGERFHGEGSLQGYTDGFVTTSPVGSFAANAHGLYDMGGNVWQWCEDWYDASQQRRALRGASWHDYDRNYLLSSFRLQAVPAFRGGNFGFRCVLEF